MWLSSLHIAYMKNTEKFRSFLQQPTLISWETYERLLITTHTQNHQTHESSKTSSHVCNMLYGILISSESDTMAYTIYYFSSETYFSQSPRVSIILGIHQFLFRLSMLNEKLLNIF